MPDPRRYEVSVTVIAVVDGNLSPGQAADLMTGPLRAAAESVATAARDHARGAPPEAVVAVRKVWVPQISVREAS